MFQFIDCNEVDGRELTKNIKSGFVLVNHSQVVIALKLIVIRNQ